MASPMLSILCLLFLLLNNSAGILRLDHNPTDIIPGLTDLLTVNCSFSFAGVTNMSDIIALIVSKSEVNTTQFQDLVSANVFAHDNMTIALDFDGAVSGHIDANGDSYISIIWTYPTADHAGIFRCEINGMDNFGHPTEMFQTLLVTSQPPNMDLLIRKVMQLQNHLNLQKILAKHQSDDLTMLQLKLEQQENLIRNQSYEIAALHSELEHQHNLEKNESDINSAQQLKLDKQAEAISDMEVKLNLLLSFYISVEHNHHYYFLSRQDLNDTIVAAKTCENYGGYLAEISDDSEHQFLKDFLDQHAGFIYVLINGTDSKHEGRWTFTGSDTDLVFTDWLSGYPRSQESRNCIIMERKYDWQWWDATCTAFYGVFKVLCELEMM